MTDDIGGLKGDGKKSIYQGIRYIMVRYIDVALYMEILRREQKYDILSLDTHHCFRILFQN